MSYFLLIGSALCVVAVVLMYFFRSYPAVKSIEDVYPVDNALEQNAEKEIKDHTGIEVDLSANIKKNRKKE